MSLIQNVFWEFLATTARPSLDCVGVWDGMSATTAFRKSSRRKILELGICSSGIKDLNLQRLYTSLLKVCSSGSTCRFCVFFFCMCVYICVCALVCYCCLFVIIRTHITIFLTELIYVWPRFIRRLSKTFLPNSCQTFVYVSPVKMVKYLK